MIRLFANLIVILGCGYLGVLYASRADARIHQLMGLEAVLSRLSFNMGFLTLPFAQALCHAARSQGGRVGYLLEEMAEKMTASPDLQPEAAFDSALQKLGGGALREPELEALRAFMTHAGRGDCQYVLDGARMTGAKLKLIRERIEAERDRDGKLWRGLGFLGGIFLVVLLL